MARTPPLPLVLGTAVAVLALDAATKQGATNWLPRDGLELVADVRLQAGENSGIAFGFLSGAGAAVVIVVVAAVVGLVAVLLSGRHLGVPAAAAGLVLGGALGNLIDRIADRAVTDFIDIGPWPSFNFADAAITLGVSWWILATFRNGARTESPAASRHSR